MRRRVVIALLALASPGLAACAGGSNPSAGTAASPLAPTATGPSRTTDTGERTLPVGAPLGAVAAETAPLAPRAPTPFPAPAADGGWRAPPPPPPPPLR
jgi:hypothetical protein